MTRLFIFSLFVMSAYVAFAADVPQTVLTKERASSSTWTEQTALTIDQIPDFTPGTEPALDVYGGWQMGTSAASNGFFRVRRFGDRWWFVDPMGNPFISKGVAVLDPGASERQVENLTRIYTNKTNWATHEIQFLKGLGFNSLGAWSKGYTSVRKYVGEKIPYTVIVQPMNNYNKELRESGAEAEGFADDGGLGYPYAFPCVFDEGFDARLEQDLAGLASYKDDPWLLGYFIDNELPWRTTALSACLTKWPTNHLNNVTARAWYDARKGKANASVSQMTDEDRRAFAAYCLEIYLGKVTRVLRRIDPNHLFLGSRFNSWKGELVSPEAFAAAGRYMDVISINHYNRWQPSRETMANWSAWSGRPFMITEFYTKGDDSGMANTSGAGWIVPTQDDRGIFYQNFVHELLSCGNCVGWHWFRYMDNDPTDTTVDSSNTDSNKGIVAWDLTRYQPLVDRMKALNDCAYGLLCHEAARDFVFGSTSWPQTNVFGRVRLTADADWRSRGMVCLDAGARIDLNGHCLRVSGLEGGAQSRDLTCPSGSISSTPVDAGSAAYLFSDQFYYRTDTTHRIRVEPQHFPFRVTYDFVVPTAVCAYRLYFKAYNNLVGRAPRDWTYEASDDNEHWTVLDSQAGVTDWTCPEIRTYAFANTRAYRYYRLSITAVAGTAAETNLELYQLEYLNGTTCPEVTDDSAGSPGRLRVDLSEGLVLPDDPAVILSGNMTLAKDGAGTLVSAPSNRVFTGEIEVAAGRYDLAGRTNAVDFTYCLAGGILANSVAYDVGASAIGRVRLTADSSFEFLTNCTCNVLGAGETPAQIALNGHTLSVSGPTRLYSLTIPDEGTVKFLDMDRTFYAKGAANVIDARQARFMVLSRKQIEGTVNVGHYEERSTRTWAFLVKKPINVFKSFTPKTDYFAGCVLQDGATLNLTGRKTPFALKGSLRDADYADVDFAPNARICVDVRGRTLLSGDRLLLWPARPNATFVLPSELRDQGWWLEAGSEALVIRRGLILSVR